MGSPEIVVSVVVPVYNLAGSIVHNATVIRDRVAAGVDGKVEVIVVSDGSIDRTDEVVLESGLENVRLLHYDRNLGKGYAVKIGTLEARGRWVAYCDADLDLDPAMLPAYVAEAERDGLDFAIGSKRHQASQVEYPRSRRVASWFFQQYVRVLFRLDVRDTQVGLKVFRREVADQVVPLLLVKRYAFDIELLAVARAFGFSRVREMPVTLEYQFTGSGVRPWAVAVALTDAAAIFYRLRIAKTYQRKRALFGAYGWTRPTGFSPSVAVVASDERAIRRIDDQVAERLVVTHPDDWRDLVDRSRSDLVVRIEDGATVSGNFLTATVPFFARPEVAAVVVSNVAPAAGGARARAAAAIRESRFGGGSQYYRFLPGNIRYVRDFRSASYIVRRAELAELPRSVADEAVPEELAAAGGRVVYTPEAFVVAPAAPLFRRHLAHAAAYGRARAEGLRRHGVAALRPSTAFGLGAATFLAFGWLLFLAGQDWFGAWAFGVLAYALLVSAQSALAGVQHRSPKIGALTALGLVLTHAVYLGSIVGGLLRARGSSPARPLPPPRAPA